MKEHEHPHWRKQDTDPYTAGNLDFKLGKRHARNGDPYNPPRKEHEGSYEQGYISKD